MRITRRTGEVCGQCNSPPRL